MKAETWYDIREMSKVFGAILLIAAVAYWVMFGGLTAVLETALRNPTETNLIFSGMVAASTLVYAILTWKLVAETKSARQSQSRPFVSVALSMAHREVDLVDLVVRNDGPVGARNVKFSWTGEIPRFGAEGLKDIAFLSEGIKFLGPDQSISTLLTSFGNHPDDLWDIDVHVKAQYEGPDGRLFRDLFILDFGQYRGLVTVQDDSEEIGKHIKQISTDLGRWISGIKKPKIIIQEIDDYRSETQAARNPSPAPSPADSDTSEKP